MIARILYRLNSYLCRKRLERDPVWKVINDNERRAQKAHRKCAHLQAAKRERVHTALGWRRLAR